jgi:hypothetical protein
VVAPPCGRCARLVDLLLLRAKGLSPAMGHDSTYLRGFEDRKAREGAGARRLSYRHKRTEEHIEYLYRRRRGVRTRGIQGGRSPRIGSPHHAPRSEGNRARKLLDAAPMTAISIRGSEIRSFGRPARTAACWPHSEIPIAVRGIRLCADAMRRTKARLSLPSLSFVQTLQPKEITKWIRRPSRFLRTLCTARWN